MTGSRLIAQSCDATRTMSATCSADSETELTLGAVEPKNWELALKVGAATKAKSARQVVLRHGAAGVDARLAPRAASPRAAGA